MTHNCEPIHEALGLGDVLSPELRDLASKCCSCSGLRAEFDSLDAVLGAEAAPLAPATLVQRVMLTVREWRTAELRTVRLQVGMAVAAALLLFALGSFDIAGDTGAEAWLPDHQGALAYVQSSVADLQLQLDLALAEGLSSLPSPPLLLLAALVPVLLLSNWSLCRGRLQRRLT